MLHFPSFKYDGNILPNLTRVMNMYIFVLILKLCSENETKREKMKIFEYQNWEGLDKILTTYRSDLRNPSSLILAKFRGEEIHWSSIGTSSSKHTGSVF